MGVGRRFYFDWANYRTMLRLLREEPNPAQRRKLYGAFLIGVPFIAGIHAICFALDPILFPSLRGTQVREPTFCVGHARSGTTYLHRLMAKDPQFSYVLMYEMFFPSLLEKRLLRLLFRIDDVSGKRLRHRLDAIEQRAFAETNDMHRTGFFAPEEDDFLLTWSLGSGFWIVMFPYMGELDFYHVDRWSERKRRRMMTFYKECVRRQLALNGGGIHLSKNPTFCGRVEALIETFPDARFVVPVRNPYETIPSLLKLLQTSWTLRQRDEGRIADSLRVLAENSYHGYLHPFEVLDRHPDVTRVVVDYRDLVSDPAGTVRFVYAELGLEVSPAFAATLVDERGRPYASNHSYSLDEYGLEPDEIRRRLGPLFERFDWDHDEEVD